MMKNAKLIVILPLVIDYGKRIALSDGAGLFVFFPVHIHMRPPRSLQKKNSTGDGPA